MVCMPIQQLGKTLTFYKNVFGLPDLQVEEGVITSELPNLSLFLMEKGDFESYSKKAVRGTAFPGQNVGSIISCALMYKEDVDKALEDAPKFWGTVESTGSVDESYGDYMGYIADPDGHLWELVFPPL